MISKKPRRHGHDGPSHSHHQLLAGGLMCPTLVRIAMLMPPQQHKQTVKEKRAARLARRIPGQICAGKSQHDADTVTACLLLRDLGISRAAVARAFGVKAKTLYQWEMGTNRARH